jgi:AcrR family transcriptional regulator
MPLPGDTGPHLQPGSGLREQKKARTRVAIAAAAADLFGRHGYPNVTMAQVAVASGVADQTLYNYFPTKESLVFDRSAEAEAGLLEALSSRPADASLIDAFAGWLDGFLLGDAARRSLRHPGGMPQLVVTSGSLRRALLDLTHQMATSVAAQLHEIDGLAEPTATAVADALLAVFARAIEQVGAAADEAALRDVRNRVTAAIEAVRPLAAAASADAGPRELSRRRC